MSSTADLILRECIEAAKLKRTEELHVLGGVLADMRAANAEHQRTGSEATKRRANDVKRRLVAELKRLLPEYNDIRKKHYARAAEFTFDVIEYPSAFLHDTENVFWGILNEAAEYEELRRFVIPPSFV